MGIVNTAANNGSASSNRKPAEAWLNLTMVLPNGEEVQLPMGIPLTTEGRMDNKQKAIVELLLNKAKAAEELSGDERKEFLSLKSEFKATLTPVGQSKPANLELSINDI